MLDLEQRHLDMLLPILGKHVPGVSVWAFGSRVKGTAQKFSDLDIAIDAGRPLGMATLALLEQDLSDSDLPIKVDVVDLAAVSPAFRAWWRRGACCYGGHRRQRLHVTSPHVGHGQRANALDRYLEPGMAAGPDELLIDARATPCIHRYPISTLPSIYAAWPRRRNPPKNPSKSSSGKPLTSCARTSMLPSTSTSCSASFSSSTSAMPSWSCTTG